ncbi:MAG: hypothetical protein Q9197_004551 [Variospora fuerteventurae]
MMEYDQLEAAGNPIIPRTAPFHGERFEAFKALATTSKAHGSLIIGQVSHPGRQCESRIQPDPVSASDVQLQGNVMGMQFNKPHLASPRKSNASRRLRPLRRIPAPRRLRRYGGSLVNRSRLILEIAPAIRSHPNIPASFILGIKINSVEFQARGFDPAECKALCASLESHRFDFVELAAAPFFLDFAETIVPALSQTKTYITGGFKTVGAMVRALDTVDGVGLARPVCQEPRLCADILAGKVQGAIKQRLDDDDFGLTNVAAGTQIRMVGRDQEPIDLSQVGMEEAFRKDMGDWTSRMAHDTGHVQFWVCGCGEDSAESVWGGVLVLEKKREE